MWTIQHLSAPPSRAIGANDLADVCSRLEMAGKNDQWSEIEAGYPDLEPALNSVIEYIEAL